MTSKATDTGNVQVLYYLKRNPKFTRDEFWAYWKDVHGPKFVPVAEKYGFVQYQQLRAFGKVIPESSPESAPNVADVEAKGETAGLVEFDGIAMFLVPSLDSIQAAIEDPYYLNVVKPDEYNLMDNSAPGRGVVASFHGLIVPIVQNGDDATGDELQAEVQKSREAFAEISGVAKA